MIDSEMLYSRVMALLATGQHLNLDMPAAIGRLEPFQGWDDINRIGWQVWDEMAERLTISDLILLTQMLTVLEREFQWSGGSVASPIWLYRNIERREPHVARLLAGWLTPRTDNGCLRKICSTWIRSGAPCKNLRAARDEAERYATLNRECREAQRSADLERERQAEALAREAEEAKTAYIMGAQAAGQETPANLLRYVALDTKHMIDFFPKAWARVSRDDLLQLDPGTRIALAERLGRTSSVTWRRLYKRLIELDSA